MTTFSRVRKLFLSALAGPVCLFGGCGMIGAGCASFGMEDVPAYVSVASRVVGAVASAEQSRRVTEAQRRCGEIEQAAATARDVETAAVLLRELAEAQKELADALEEHAPAPTDGGR